MKILFYTTDIEIQNVYSEISSELAVLCSNSNDLDNLIQENSPCIVILDFDNSELNCREVSSKLKENSNVSTVLLTGAMELSEIVSIQDTHEACDAYLTRPISKEIILDIASDFELSMGASAEDHSFNTLSESDEDIEKMLEANSSELEDEEEEVDFSFDANEFKISDEVREVVDQHNQTETNYDDEVNQDIQRKFDSVFGKKEIVEKEEIDVFADLNPSFEEASQVESGAISFDLDEDNNESEDSSIEDNGEVEQASPKEVSMSEDNDEIGGLEFNLPDEEDNSAEVSQDTQEAPQEVSEGLDFSLDGDDSSEVSDDTTSDEGGLEFRLDDSGVEDAEVAPIQQEKEEDDDGLDFGDEESDGLSLSAEGDEVEAAPVEEDTQEDGLDFGDEESDGLSLSAEGDEVEAAPVEEDTQEDGLDFGDGTSDGLSLSAEGDEVEAAPVEEDTQEDGLDFGDDSAEELNLSAEGDEIDTLSPDEGADDGALDFSETPEEVVEESNDEEGLDFSVDEESSEVDSTSDFKIGQTGDIDATINSIIAPTEDSTGEFDMSQAEDSPEVVSSVEENTQDDMQEFDYKTSSGFSPVVEDESVGEDTNPTIIAQTGTLNGGDLLDEQTSTEDSTASELSFSENLGDDPLGQLSNIDNTGETVVATNFSIDEDENLTQTVQTQSQSQPSRAPQMSAKEELDTLRSYDEDEMLRLQGTIRQLREEREDLMGQINGLNSEKQLLEQDNLGLKAELDEVKIELGIVKKRYLDDLSEKDYQTKLNEEKKDLYETKAKSLQKDFDRLNQKVRIDFNQVKQREKELESKLELVVMDSESQVQTRDMKILELKRKIDSLEFNMENSSIRELKHREDKSKLEERLGKIMKTLRGSIQLIEDDLDELEGDNTRELD